MELDDVEPVNSKLNDLSQELKDFSYKEDKKLF